jgi:hypothetical protein
MDDHRSIRIKVKVGMVPDSVTMSLTRATRLLLSMLSFLLLLFSTPADCRSGGARRYDEGTEDEEVAGDEATK